MRKKKDTFRGQHDLRTLTADLFVSLDGFASGAGEAAFFGYFGEDLGKWIADNLKQRQLLIMGRVTYEALAQFSPAGTDQTSRRMNELPKLVFSHTLTAPLVWKNTRLAKAPLAEEIKALKAQPGDPLRSIGSVSLVRSMVGLGVVDRLRLMVFPVILGNAGREPIFTSYSRTPLELVASKVLDSRVTLLEYRFRPEEAIEPHIFDLAILRRKKQCRKIKSAQSQSKAWHFLLCSVRRISVWVTRRWHRMPRHLIRRWPRSNII